MVKIVGICGSLRAASYNRGLLRAAAGMTPAGATLEMVSYARRVASADGTLLAVVQEGPQPNGGRFRNFQVYRRKTAQGGAEPRTVR